MRTVGQAQERPWGEYPGDRGSRAERLLPPCPDPSPACAALSPPALCSLHGLQGFVGCSSTSQWQVLTVGWNWKQTRGDKDLYVLETFLLNVTDLTVSCSFLLRVSLNLALPEPSHPVPCFPLPQIQFLFKFRTVNKYAWCETIDHIQAT